MERWYLLITEKFLFWTFKRLEIGSFFELKNWLKDDINWLLRDSCFERFGDGKYGCFFFSQRVDRNMIFTDYWKGLVLNFPEMENTAFFWAKNLMERWYLPITEKLLFLTFQWWEIRYFSQPKSLWRDDIYLVFLSFPLYSRAWGIWFFVPWHLLWLDINVNVFHIWYARGMNMKHF